MFNSTREFEACVLVRGKPVTEVVHQGHTYIEGRRNSTYELQFRNNSSLPVLVVPSVDGLSVIDGNPAGRESSGFVVDPWGSVTIPGWTVSNREAAEFVFHAQNAHYHDERTYAEESGQNPRNQGVIGFLVFRQDLLKTLQKIRPRSAKMGGPDLWERGIRSVSPPPQSVWDNQTTTGGWSGGSSTNVYGATADASVMNVSATSSVDSLGNIASNVSDAPDFDANKSLGTGFGDAVDFDTQAVEFQREDNPCATFVFYYNTKQKLRKLGVPVQQFSRHYTESYSSGPQAFPESPEVTGYAKPPEGWEGRRNRPRRRKYRR